MGKGSLPPPPPPPSNEKDPPFSLPPLQCGLPAKGDCRAPSWREDVGKVRAFPFPFPPTPSLPSGELPSFCSVSEMCFSSGVFCPGSGHFPLPVRKKICAEFFSINLSHPNRACVGKGGGGSRRRLLLADGKRSSGPFGGRRSESCVDTSQRRSCRVGNTSLVFESSLSPCRERMSPGRRGIRVSVRTAVRAVMALFFKAFLCSG